jgi:hypothetical protein
MDHPPVYADYAGARARFSKISRNSCPPLGKNRAFHSFASKKPLKEATGERRKGER